MPPSTTRAAPVMNDDSSEARNSAPLAISSARPNRPTGMWTSRAADCTAKLMDYSRKHAVSLASVSYHVNA